MFIYIANDFRKHIYNIQKDNEYYMKLPSALPYKITFVQIDITLLSQPRQNLPEVLHSFMT